MIEKSNTAKLRDAVLTHLKGAMKNDNDDGVKKNVLGWRDRVGVTSLVEAPSRIVSDLLKLNLLDAHLDKIRISREGLQYLLDQDSKRFVDEMGYEEKAALLWMYERKLRDNLHERASRRRVGDGQCVFPRDKFKEIDFVHLREMKLIYTCCEGHGVRDYIWLSPFGIQIGEYLKRKRFW